MPDAEFGFLFYFQEERAGLRSSFQRHILLGDTVP
jgi:hypothetical protein